MTRAHLNKNRRLFASPGPVSLLLLASLSCGSSGENLSSGWQSSGGAGSVSDTGAQPDEGAGGRDEVMGGAAAANSEAAGGSLPLEAQPEGSPEPAALVVTPNASGYVWRPVATGGGGFVSAIITTPSEANLIYARTDVGGAYRFREATQSWLPLTEFS